MSSYKPVINQIFGEWAEGEAEKSKRPGSLSSKEQRKEQIIDTLAWNIEEFVGRLKEGIETLIVHHSSLAEELDQASCYLVTQDPTSTIALFHEKQGLAGLLGLTNEHLLAFYDTAKNLYEKEHYGKAADTFFALCMMAPKVPSFWLGLGHSEKLSKRLESAIYAFGMAADTNPNDLTPCLEAINCLIDLGKKEQAKPILEFVEQNGSKETIKAAKTLKQKVGG